MSGSLRHTALECRLFIILAGRLAVISAVVDLWVHTARLPAGGLPLHLLMSSRQKS